jgi:serine/threonine-protein kinase HipA
MDGAPTTVVVKRPTAEFPGLLEAELVGMRLMAAAGVPVASSTVCTAAPKCHESARFDRTMDADGTVHRLHAEDGCQLTGRAPRNKYAGAGGVTYQELVAVLRRYGAAPAADREQLLRWALANAAMGNCDAHAKNVSVTHDDAGLLHLAPAYDVVVTTLFPGLDRTRAPALGGTTHPRWPRASSTWRTRRSERSLPTCSRECARRCRACCNQCMSSAANGEFSMRWRAQCARRRRGLRNDSAFS